MKLGLLIALTPDRRSVGRVLSPLLPLNEAIDAVKRAIQAGKAPDARFPVLQAVSIGSVAREHRFRPAPEEVAAFEDGSIREATVEDLAAALELAEARAEAAAARIKELQDQLAEQNAQLGAARAETSDEEQTPQQEDAPKSAKPAKAAK